MKKTSHSKRNQQFRIVLPSVDIDYADNSTAFDVEFVAPQHLLKVAEPEVTRNTSGEAAIASGDTQVSCLGSNCLYIAFAYADEASATKPAFAKSCDPYICGYTMRAN